MSAASASALSNKSTETIRPAFTPRPAPSPGNVSRRPTEGNDALFAQMIEPAQERVFRMALRIMRNKEDAEDVQQEALLKGYRKLDQFEGRAHFTTWISRIAINEALMSLRKRRTAFRMSLDETIPPEEQSLAVNDYQSPAESPEAAYLRKEMRNSLVRAIANLRPTYRSVFMMRAVERLSTIATARALRISASAVKARLRRARIELRQFLKDARVTSLIKGNRDRRFAASASRTTPEQWLA
jgi:RNA polymerase sigma-70 factor (ECF subfamily)